MILNNSREIRTEQQDVLFNHSTPQQQQNRAQYRPSSSAVPIIPQIRSDLLIPLFNLILLLSLSPDQ